MKCSQFGLAAACGFLALAMGCATTSTGPETRYVSVERLALREKPDGLSASLAEFDYKAPVVVLEDARVATPYSDDSGNFPKDLLPLWCKVSANGKTGYVPAAALASEWLISNQDPDASADVVGAAAAKRGFSESEDDMELASMKGAAGKGSVAAAADPAAVQRVLAENRSVSDSDLRAFVRAGKLASRPVPVTVVPHEVSGGVGSDIRKLGASGLGFASGLVGQVAGDNQALGMASTAGKTASDLVYSEVGPVQEFQVGKAVAARILPLHPLVPKNDPRSIYVSRVAGALAAASNDPSAYHGLQVLLMDSAEVNAFAVPGGFVFVTTGMLKFLKDEDELAAIIGHEIGHLELRHGVKAVGQEKILKLFSMLKELGTSGVGGDPVVRQQLLALADEVYGSMTASIRNGYGVETESQADWRALQLAYALGYDPGALHGVLERFKSRKGSYGGAGYPAERGADIKKYLGRLGYDKVAVSGRAARAARYAKAVGR